MSEVVSPIVLSVPSATLRLMDTYDDIPDTSYEIPMSEAEQVALRPALLRDLGAMPFGPDDEITRSLWGRPGYRR